MRVARTWTRSIGSELAVKYFLEQERKIQQTHELQEGCRKTSGTTSYCRSKAGISHLTPREAERKSKPPRHSPVPCTTVPGQFCTFHSPTVTLNQSDVNGKGKKLISAVSKGSDTGPGEQGMWSWPLVNSFSALRACSWLFQSILFSSAHGIFIGSFNESPKSPAEST